jgi:hypothetical protein
MSLAPRGFDLRAIAEHAHIRLLALRLAACRAALGAGRATAQSQVALAAAYERRGALDRSRGELEAALAMLGALAGD